MQDGEIPPGLLNRLNKVRSSEATHAVLDCAQEFFGKGTGLSHTGDNYFILEPRETPWKIILTLESYNDGNYKVNAELVSATLSTTHPKFTRIKYDYAKQPLLQTAIHYRGAEDVAEIKKDMKKFFAGVVEVMKKETLPVS